MGGPAIFKSGRLHDIDQFRNDYSRGFKRKLGVKAASFNGHYWPLAVAHIMEIYAWRMAAYGQQSHLKVSRAEH